MRPFTLARTGDIPLKFVGEHLSAVSTRRSANGQERNRWFEINLYRSEGGRYVLAIAYQTCWQGEHSTSRVIPCDSPEGVREELRLFSPLEDVGGYPPGPTYRDKQERLERSLRMDWENAVSELFDGLADEFAETLQ